MAAAARSSAAQARSTREETMIDQLTQVGNRRRFNADLERVLAEAEGAATGLCMVDLDHFKAVNDNYGHPAGDAVLVQLAKVMRGAVRPSDAVYRFGGEEFALVLPRTSLAEAVDVAERVRLAIEEHHYDTGSGEALRKTASIGVASQATTDGDSLVAMADAALYEAKGSGRNRVVAASD